MDMDYLKEQIDEAFTKERAEQEQLTNKFINKVKEDYDETIKKLEEKQNET